MIRVPQTRRPHVGTRALRSVPVRVVLAHSYCELNAGLYGITAGLKLLQPLIWQHPSYEAVSRDGADQNCKIFGDIFCLHRQGMIRKDAVGLRNCAKRGLALLIAQGGSIIAARMEMDWLQAQIANILCVRAVQRRHGGGALVLHCHVAQLACVAIQKPIACAHRTKLIFFVLVQFVLKCGAGEVMEKISWTDRVRNDEVLHRVKGYPTDNKKRDG